MACSNCNKNKNLPQPRMSAPKATPPKVAPVVRKASPDSSKLNQLKNKKSPTPSRYTYWRQKIREGKMQADIRVINEMERREKAFKHTNGLNWNSKYEDIQRTNI